MAKLRKTQFNSNIAERIQTEIDVFKEFTYQIKTVDNIPSTDDIPKEDQNHATKWLKVEDITCIYVDMANSTQLSTGIHAKSTARIYRYFSSTIVRIFREFGAAYIDLKGDGVLALFDNGKEHTALAALVSARTFVAEFFTPDVKSKHNLTVEAHFGVDLGTVLVRRVGIRKRDGTGDQARNEIWAGKVINRASKLASSEINIIVASKKFFDQLFLAEALLSCGCGSSTQSDLWEAVDASSGLEKITGLKTVYHLKSIWCVEHGAEYCQALLDIETE